MPIKFLNDVAVDSSVLYVDTVNDRVGIGTASPDVDLHIAKNSGNAILQLQRTGTNSGSSRLTVGNQGRLIVSSDRFITFNTDGSERMRVDYGGNVGIGTTSPSQKLDVNGNIELAQYGYIYFGSNTSDQLTINNSLSGSQIIQRGSSYLELQSFNGSGIKFNVGGFLGTDVMVVTSSANVGIGTTSPSQKLHVVGNTKIEGVVIVNSANSSLYIGDSNTGQSSTSTGDRNVVIGPSAFRSNTSAKYNTAVGHAAMQDTTTGNYNSVLGNQALRDNIDGDFNVAVGNQTMAFTTNSSNNTAVGYRALYQAQSDSNTAIGQGAFNSLQSSTSSGGNTGIGQEVLNKITSGRRNVGVGHAAGQKYGGGNNNVVTANDSVFIGADSDAGGDNQTNQIVIGYNAIGLGSNTAVLGNNSIVTTQLKGNVGIGTTSPSQKLHVSGNARVTGAYYDSNNSPGTSNQVLVSTVTGTDWIDGTAIPGLVDGTGTANYVARWIGTESIGIGVIYDNGTNVGIGTTSPGEKLTLQTQATGLGSEGVFIKNPFAGSTPIVNSKSPFLSLATSNSSGYTSTIYMGRNGTATGQESKIEWSNSNNGLSIYVAGQGSYREHVRFGNLSSSVARTYFNGNVGIGTTSAAYLLDVNEDDNILAFRVTGGGGGAPIASFVRDVGATGSSVNINAQSNFPQIQFANTGNTFSIGGDTSGNFKISDNTGIGTNDRITIDNTGNVGIGTTSPAAKLEVNGTSLLRGLVNITTSGEMLRLNDTNSSGNPYMSFYQSGARRSFIQHNDSGDYLKLASEYGGISFFTGTGGTSTQKMTILSGGDVGIGTTSPGSRLSVIDASTGRTWSDYFATVATFERNSDSNINIVSSDTGNGAIWFGDTSSMVRGRIRYAHNGDEMSFWVSAAPRATLDSSGNLAITGTLSQNSDIVLKENVEDIDGALEKVKQLRGVEFNMIGNDKKQLGVIAQEVEKVLPELVTEKDDIRSVAYGNIAAVLIEAIKEQQNQIENLESRIQTLENQ